MRLIQSQPHFRFAFPVALFIAQVLLTSCTCPWHCQSAAATNRCGNLESDQVMSLVWFEYSGEARALYYQAYNVARDRVDEAIAKNGSADHLAVIMDIDETILDNSPYQASLVLSGKPYTPQTWTNWDESARSQLLPGAKSFLDYAASRGVEIFYITRRGTNEFDATEKNLQSCGLPMVDDHHLLLQKAHEGKEPNRQSVAQQDHVVLLMGDNLDDFSDIFDRYDIKDRFDITDANRDQFGRRFIVLPNPMYGDWETTIYSRQKLTEAQKAAVRWQLVQQLNPSK